MNTADSQSNFLNPAFGRGFSFAGLALDRPRIMGVVNVTPDSFSDGGQFAETDAAVQHGLALMEAGAEILEGGLKKNWMTIKVQLMM